MNNREQLKFFAEYFYNLNLNINVVSNKVTKFNVSESPKRLKSPAYEWEIYQSERQKKEILIQYNWADIFGFGIILGFNNVAAIDLDGCVDERVIEFILKYLGLPKNYNWVIKSGSQAGFHIIFKTVLPDKNAKRVVVNKLSVNHKLDQQFGKEDVNAYYPIENTLDSISFKKVDFNSFCKIEFKWKGFIILPPSLHSCGKEYKFLNEIPRYEPIEVDFLKLSELQILISGNAAVDSRYEGIIAQGDTNEKIPDYYALVIDTETNGLPKDFKKDFTHKDNWPRLLQISWLACDVLTFASQTLFLSKREVRNVKPNNFILDKEAELIHGLSSAFLEEVGEDLHLILYDFVEKVKKCSVIIGHNIEYDLNIIKCELLRCGIDLNHVFDNKITFCTMKASIDLCALGPPPHKFPSLSELYYECFKSSIEIEHNSTYDAIITLKCLNEIQKFLKGITFPKYVNSIDKEKELENTFKNLTGLNKLRFVINTSGRLNENKREYIDSIKYEDVKLLSDESIDKLLYNLQKQNKIIQMSWKKVIQMIEQRKLDLRDDNPF